MPRSRILAAALLGAAVAFPTAQERPVRTIKDGILDRIELFVDRPPKPADTVVVIKPFGTEKADLGTGGPKGDKEEQDEAKAMQAEAPKELVDAFIAELAGRGGFKGILRDGDGDVIVDGSFTVMNPGSRAKRYWVGFGAGKSAMEVDGSLRDGSGKLLARFHQRRIGAVGVFGGDSVRKMKQDSRNLGEDIAKFLHAWMNGKALD